MNLNQTLYAFFVSAFASVSIVALYLLVIYSLTTKKLEEAKRNWKKNFEDIQKDRDEILTRAQKDYQEVISSANERARQIIEAAEKTSQDSGLALHAAVDKLVAGQSQTLAAKSQELLKESLGEIEKLSRSDINTLNKLSEDIVKNAQSHIEDFKKTLASQTFASEKIAQDKIKVEYEQLEKELQEYRNQALAKIENNIYNILLNISKLTIGRTLDLTGHEELILEALNKAKSEGGLD